MKVDFILNKLLGPVLLIVLGLILTFSPDSASALIAAILGWVLIVAAALTAILVLALVIRMVVHSSGRYED